MSYQPAVQKTIDYIERNLERELTGERIAAEAGFSFHHFHRIFRSETGMTMSDYIRSRRLAGAASALLHTDERILDLALRFGFESQEAFGRAFKKIYGLPPARYRRWMGGMLSREDDSMQTKQDQTGAPVKGWFLSGSHPFHYEMGIDRKEVHRGTGSGYLKSVMSDSPEQFGTMMQAFRADKFRGKRVRLSAFAKTRGVEQGFAALWMRVDAADGDVLQFDNMANRPLTGTTDWNHYAIVLDVPPRSDSISFGALLSGTGQLWVDGFSFEEVPDTVPTTNLETSGTLHDEPVNLSFEEDIR
ncbi:helix-turn-helix domain-containing protein [Saccharibacillus alkalitolerans]|uniref:Helix-turn-helix transcriptional regulator n=1 Tax=Saccharibacillus alkalitolerans TaxID=2705290 RepID=A0ABX0F5M1_9BACL|nr:AraC family transcriptional regulator [Saccharibacillus alkalitolerans]NGZ76251.1 helix-turn-helix transcriptional regulator [Saccharibacillus alkalitolerans]